MFPDRTVAFCLAARQPRLLGGVEASEPLAQTLHKVKKAKHC
jgi:hypothetical protein